MTENSDLSDPESRLREELFCSDLPTRRLSGAGRILITGASGYIGGRLVPELLARGYRVRVMVRGRPEVYRNLWPDVEVSVGNALKQEGLTDALDGIETAYYLIHSLHLGPEGFEATDILAASNFRMAAEEKGVKRIIYLGGLGDIGSSVSSHLCNRMEVGQQLWKGRVPVTVLRAAVIIGAGSASYEIIEHLVKSLPVMLIPPWARNRCQPVSIRDVVKYLVGVLEVPATTGKSLDIGGKDILTYEEMLKILAKLLHKKILFIPFPLLPMNVYAYFASLLTPVPHPIAQCLMEGLQDEVVCRDKKIHQHLPLKLLTYRAALVQAMSREEQDRVSTRWSDAYPPAHELAMKLNELKGEVAYTTRYSLLTGKRAARLFRSICRVGGVEGWFHGNWMWRLRGLVDRILLGVGTSRGRRSRSRLRLDDVIDFWRVEAMDKDERLLLRAEMKLPGKAWLEFTIREEDGSRRLSVAAYYDTQSLWGVIYWYACLPFHLFIFQRLIEEIDKKS